ncbi:DNA alkylation repair protein [Algibacillus agarilyticus]|uniref:DNA alkylation repair protein n=1 Tax=Algibacillus agarilyticus TaxID=2234133 RepID=UPI000DD0BCE4|nr:DNA alkylation repair protein [Algibacillus agarilyticus]
MADTSKIEPFKNLLNETVIREMAAYLQQNYAEFNQAQFINDALTQFDTLELKQRTDRITQCMVTHLPANFEHSAQIIKASLGQPLGDGDISATETDGTGISGWVIIAVAEFVVEQGHNHFDLTMSLLKTLTQHCTAEFAIRPLILANQNATLDTLQSWINDKNHHVRRLISEGTRPRLPWGIRLKPFIDDPDPVIKLLEQLKDDSSEYVRRSVANNLNDIAKDHPDRVADIAEQWLLNASNERIKLVKHACRTLIKQGHKKTLLILGYGPAAIKNVNLTLDSNVVEFGTALNFNLTLQSTNQQPQALMIDYIIHHQKSNGSTSPKVFKWRTTSITPTKTLQIEKRHAIKKITTRTYYPGKHRLEIVINGQSVAQADFDLKM